MHVIAGASPDNTPAGYYWTFLFPEILFIVIALILWALFGRPHQRVPARRIMFGLGSPTARVTAAAATTAGPTASAGNGAPLVASAEPAASADDTDGAQPSADGAEAGE